MEIKSYHVIIFQIIFCAAIFFLPPAEAAPETPHSKTPKELLNSKPNQENKSSVGSSGHEESNVNTHLKTKKEGKTKGEIPTEEVKKIAELVIGSADTQIIAVTTIATLAMGTVTILFTIAGIAGWMEWKKLKEANKRWDSLTNELKKSVELGKLMHRNIFLWHEASNYLIKYLDDKTDKNKVHNARFYFEKIKDNKIDEIDDNLFLSLFYGSYGIALRHTVSERKALEMVKKSVEYDPNNYSSWYNAACYAAILGEKADAIKSLTTAISLKHSYKDEAKDDDDLLLHLKDQKEFRNLVGLSEDPEN